MTDQELDALERVTVNDAARYLASGITAQEIRVLAQNGRCAFCHAVYGVGRYSYRVNVGLLKRAKAGEFGII